VRRAIEMDKYNIILEQLQGRYFYTLHVALTAYTEMMGAYFSSRDLDTGSLSIKLSLRILSQSQLIAVADVKKDLGL